MASGLEADPKCVEVFKSLKSSRTYQSAIFKINDEMTSVQVDKTFPPSDGGSPRDKWVSFASQLPEDDCRYVVYDFDYEHQGAMKNRLLFILWSPDNSKGRNRFVYAATREAFINKLEGVQRSIECTDKDDIDYTAISKLLAAHTAGY